MHKSVMIQVWGKHVLDKKPINKAAQKGKDTKAIMRAETIKKGMARGDLKQVCYPYIYYPGLIRVFAFLRLVGSRRSVLSSIFFAAEPSQRTRRFVEI